MCALLTACERLPLPSGHRPARLRGLHADALRRARVALGGLVLAHAARLRASRELVRRAPFVRAARCEGRRLHGPRQGRTRGHVRRRRSRHHVQQRARVTLVRDCPRGGEQCVVREGHAVCALGSCEKETAPACSPSGTRVLECKKGKLLSLDCGAFGLQCTSSCGRAEVRDAGRDLPRGSDALRRLDRGRMLAWSRGARRLRCARARLRRRQRRQRRVGVVGAVGASAPSPSSSSVGACAVIAPPARPAGTTPARRPRAIRPRPPRCDGASLRWCAWGQPRSYLCKSVGLQRCVSDDKGARCAP